MALTSSLIRRYVYNLKEDTLFSIRALLSYGPRSAVDRAVGRLVARGILERIAWGIYIKPSGQFVHFTNAEIADAKARAFAKHTFTHGATIAIELGLMSPDPSQPSNNDNSRVKANRLAVVGSTSSFWSVNGRIRLHSTAPKTVALAEHPIGLIIRALIALGPKRCTFQVIHKIKQSLTRKELAMLVGASRWMPAWLSDKACHNYYGPSRR